MSHKPWRLYVGLVASLTVLGLASCGSGNDKDTTPPTVSLQSLPTTLSRTVTLAADASDDVSVVSVEFKVDGVSLGSDTTAPYSFDWNSGGVADGAHTVTAHGRDALNNEGISSAVTVTVRNQLPFAVAMSGREENPANAAVSAGSGTLTVNLASGAVSGFFTVSGFTAVAAHIHSGHAGTNGPVIVNFSADPANPGRWGPAAGAALTTAQVDALLVGGLYVNAHSATFPGGEVRAQLLPAGIVVYFVDLAGLQEVPEVATRNTARGAITLNTATRVATYHVNTVGLNDAVAAHMHRGNAGTNGPVAVNFTKDPANAAHFSAENVTLAQADFDALQSAGGYLNVHTPANAGGEVRGQVVPSGYGVVVNRVSGEQEVPARITAARGTTAVTVRTATGAIEVHVNVTGADDSSQAHIHDGFAGLNGPVIVGLEKDPAAITHWRSNGATLTSTQVATLLDGGLYANVHTPAAPAGLVRGQLLPDGVQLVIAHMTGAQENPAVATTATGRASVTVNTVAKKLTIHANTSDLLTATVAHIHRGARGINGPVQIGLTKDASSTRWSATGVALTDDQLADYRAGNWYVNAHTPTNPGGEIRGQVELPGVTPLQFSDIQARVFNASCATSGCHAGSTPRLGMSLVAGSSFAAIVGVPAVEAPGLLRVEPGNPANSYLVRKLEGAAGIVGARMPLDGAALPQDVINGIRAWINAGALGAATVTPGDTTAPVVILGTVPATSSGTVTLTATATDDVAVSLVRWRVNGAVVGSDATAPYSLDWNSTTVANGAVTIDAQALDATGNVGTSTTAASTVSNAAAVTAFTFTEIQTQVFTATCAASGCHGGAAPQQGLSLVAPAYASVVGVASTEVPSLQRIRAGDATNSYLVQKLEGTASVGARMPLGGPFLDATAIARIRAWVNAGAPNN